MNDNLRKTRKGDLAVIIADRRRDIVRINFNHEVTSLGLDGKAAKSFAHKILRAAETVLGEPE